MNKPEKRTRRTDQQQKGTRNGRHSGCQRTNQSRSAFIHLTKGRTLLHGHRWAAKEIETAVDSDRTQKKEKKSDRIERLNASPISEAVNNFSKKEIISISQTWLMEMNAQF